MLLYIPISNSALSYSLVAFFIQTFTKFSVFSQMSKYVDSSVKNTNIYYDVSIINIVSIY